MIAMLGAVFVASFLGSLHCVSMCGSFVAIYSAGDVSQGKSTWVLHLAYNGGRLLTYLGLGVAAGSLGAALNLAGEAGGLSDVAAIVAGALIVAWGAAQLLSLRMPGWWHRLVPDGFARVLGQVAARAQSRPPLLKAFLLGASSTLLPCGWLYGFAATAAGTAHPLSGALVMAAFWLGSVPAMVSAGVITRSAARVIGPRLGVIMPAALVIIGMLTIAQRVNKAPAEEPCHHSGTHSGSHAAASAEAADREG